MHHADPLNRRRRRALGALLTLAATLAGCGGGDAPLPGETSDAAPAFRRSRPSVTPDQLAWEELVATPCTVVIDVDAVGSVAAAVQLAEQVRWWRDTQGLAFFVRARRPADAAQVADRLGDAGFGAVFVVV